MNNLQTVSFAVGTLLSVNFRKNKEEWFICFSVVSWKGNQTASYSCEYDFYIQDFIQFTYGRDGCGNGTIITYGGSIKTMDVVNVDKIRTTSMMFVCS